MVSVSNTMIEFIPNLSIAATIAEGQALPLPIRFRFAGDAPVPLLPKPWRELQSAMCAGGRGHAQYGVVGEEPRWVAEEPWQELR
jgi:hypothetical protein